MFRKVYILFCMQGWCHYALPTILEDCCMSSSIPTSLYIRLDVFSKGFKKENIPISRHGHWNVQMAEKTVQGKMLDELRRKRVLNFAWQLAKHDTIYMSCANGTRAGKMWYYIYVTCKWYAKEKFCHMKGFPPCLFISHFSYSLKILLSAFKDHYWWLLTYKLERQLGVWLMYDDYNCFFWWLDQMLSH